MFRMLARPFGCWCLLLALRCASPAAAAEAGSEAVHSFDVPAGEAVDTLKNAARQGRVEIVFFFETVRGVRTPALRGLFRARDALERLVAGTGLVVVHDRANGMLLVQRPVSSPPPPRRESSVDPPQPHTPPVMKRKNPLSVLGAWLALALVSSPSLPGAEAASPTGAIEGRVFSASSENYLERVRVTVENSTLETLTDADGTYRFPAVPAGTARVKFFYTGFPIRTESVAVAAAQTARLDVTLGAADGKVVQLDAFTVVTSKEMSASALAINEQRFAPNMRTVVATDELGFVPEGNVAEFMKFLPGVTIESSGGFAREVSINGVPAEYVPITIAGFSLASAHPGGGTGRNVALDMVSINNLSRVEVSFSPTPESQGSALAGSVNMIPRSAFERSRPVFTVSTYLLMRDNARDFHKTPGPRREPTRKVHPGLDFTYIRPVNARFGFTVSGGTSKNHLYQDNIENVWRGAHAATNGAAFPHTTTDNPYLSASNVRDNSKDSQRNSFSVTLDYKLTANDRLSFSFQYATTNFANMSRTLTFNVGRVVPGQFTTTSTRGVVGAGTLMLANAGQTRDNRTYMPTLVWRHIGPTWHTEAGLGHSHARNVLRGIDRGFMNAANAQRTGVTIAFDDNIYLRPGRITVTDGATGAPVDPYRLANYALTTTSGNTQYTFDLQRTAYVNARRDFAGRLPFSLKTGLDVRQSVRDIRGYRPPYTVVGADGRASTTIGGDDNAAPFLDASYSERVPQFGFPRIQWISNELLWEHFQANPSHYAYDENGYYRSTVSQSKYAEEIVSSAYLRGDLTLAQGRLRFVGGLRAEQTNIAAEGPLTDPTRNFQRNAAGDVILASNGRPLQITNNALEVSKLTFLHRGTITEKEYLRLFPSLNASYNVRENLVARAAHYYSVGRPNFDQYAGGVSLPNTEDVPGPGNRITVNNAGIKAWSARTTSVRLEHYFEGVGQISVGAFRRDFENFFGSTVFPASAEFLGLYGLDPALYGNYEVATQENVSGTVRMTGVDASYKQALTFLPRWARGVQVFANVSSQRATGAEARNFAGFVPRSGSWGISLTREKFNVRANWNYRGRQRRNERTGAGIEPGTYIWGPRMLTIDLQGEYYVHPKIAVFASMRNATNVTEDVEIAGPNTPGIAKLQSRVDFGSLWTIGLKGTF